MVNTALHDRPLIKRFIGDRATGYISGLLGSGSGTQLTHNVSSKLYAYITGPDREDVTIELTPITASLNVLITLAQTQGGGDRLESAQAKIPDQVTLLESDVSPDLSQLVRTMLWAGPLLWIAAVGAFSGYIYLHRSRYTAAVYTVAAVISTLAVLGLFIAPFIPAPLAAALPTINLRPLAENLVSGFLRPFEIQMMIMLGVTVIVTVIFSQRGRIAWAAQRISSRLSSTPKRSSNS